jgi:hypothetical protein
MKIAFLMKGFIIKWAKEVLETVFIRLIIFMDWGGITQGHGAVPTKGDN